MESLFWHDYETFGSDARCDRPCQFAGIRTDLELNIIDEPIEFFCQPAPDFLPDPEACVITGITPRTALQKGIKEAAFCARIEQELAQPGTCGVGYNSIRFDDELTRHLLYRNFYDPYEREWKQGNSRWDLIDVLRMTQALRPDGIAWPLHEDGSPSFRLEALTQANGIPHADAHDALADVRATIAMAKLVKTQQPRLYDFLFQLRSKHRVMPLLDLVKQEPVVHVSRMFAASRGCLAIVLPLCRHPTNPNGVVVVDLLSDPAAWLDLTAEQIQQRLFTPTAELPAGVDRIPLKTVHSNRCPALAPMNVLTPQIMQRYHLDLPLIQQSRSQLLNTKGLVERVLAALQESKSQAVIDPDLALYSGAFLGDHDKRLSTKVRSSAPEQLAALASQFKDQRLPELLFRYRARNYPETLSVVEQARWQQYCRARLQGEVPGAGVTLVEHDAKLLALHQTGRLSEALWTELNAYATQLAARYDIERHCTR
jgi:exodeoxyribonuclease I